LDGDIRRHTGSNEFTYGIYYFFAESFGWDKRQVDKLPLKYLKGILWMNKKQVKEMEKEDFKGSSKKGNIAIPRNTGRQIKKTFK
tara:strand:- start:164 stop:418 length:255 start_codon:yes stop_codon:yes gene_type:complete